MELNDLKEYLSMIVDMEKNIVMIDDTINSLEKELPKLGINGTFEKPVKPVKSNVIAGKSEDKAGAWLVILALFVFGIFISFNGIADLGLILIAISVVVMIIMAISESNSRKVEEDIEEKKYNSEMRKYEKCMEEYNKSLGLDKKRVNNEIIVRDNLSEKIKNLHQIKSESQEKLDEMYSLDIVFPKYRNFTMMCTIYEYINSGRCYTLEGPEGAYNILENEIRMDRVIVQLDLALSKLDMIARNQFMLYRAVEENNRQQRLILESTDQILSCVRSMNSNIQKSTEELKASLESIDKNSALTAYAAERSQKELEYMNTMNYLESKYRGTGFNQPPSWRS